jgi:prepilin-type N-terminal cleavage/methylation domain-containing protein
VRTRRAFTLIELIAVIIILAILGGVALPAFFDYATEARASADAGSLGGMRTALNVAFAQHRVDDAPSTEWVLTVNDIVGAMESGQLPEGVTISGGKILLQGGDLYSLNPETVNSPATLYLDP